MRDAEKTLCNICRRPIEFDFEKFADDDGKIVHQFCYENKIIEAAIKAHFRKPMASRDLINTPAFVDAQRKRKKVEALFAELKNQIGLRCLRLRRLKLVREQFFLAAAAQNIK
jgi:Transposase DDE domain